MRKTTAAVLRGREQDPALPGKGGSGELKAGCFLFSIGGGQHAFCGGEGKKTWISMRGRRRGPYPLSRKGDIRHERKWKEKRSDALLRREKKKKRNEATPTCVLQEKKRRGKKENRSTHNARKEKKCNPALSKKKKKKKKKKQKK